MANFGPPKFKKEGTETDRFSGGEKYNYPKQRDPRTEAIGVFKSFVVQMTQKKKNPDEIVVFVKNPTPLNYGFKDTNEVRDVIFVQILKFTSLEERLKILEELYDSGNLGF